MTRTFFAAAAAVLAFATPALAHERSFTHEGVTYAYTATSKGDARILEGKTSTGDKFRLVVKDGWVTGYAADTRVSFRAPKGDATLQVAQR
ncbi:MAG: hypothetical protein J7500_18010 [Sphingomonas sp.]|uniref:hypothetical protein n=1 Tax=Sphingomonas sp. TaxID=28214 RepID=UPI001B07FF1F|nr:hypothetical protein [Sphingomonas sp.]MBO9624606.1 hypothetical protein [Sphingomonas sp.]